MDIISKAVDAAASEFQTVACRIDEPMREHTSFRIGGPVRAMYFPKTAEEAADIFHHFSSFGITPLVLGNGTNMLVEDAKPLDIVAVNTSGLNDIELIDNEKIVAGAGVALSKLALFAYEHCLSGLEFAHGIPGTLGGAVVMNAGAYGAEMKDIIYRTDAFNMENGYYAVVNDEHEFSYRHSRFTDNSDIILSSAIKAVEKDSTGIKALMDELNRKRRESQPLDMLSAGSTFKRPAGGYAAELIEQAGLKGYEAGGAKVSQKHAGFVVNTGGATFSDVMAVIDHVIERVYIETGIELEPELKIIRG
ncbi:MAG: UDP-N-acetylmuramate dehydrogenase [Oscillospiraceae bacterium]|nr:UDP-N-acetylmuramate dehydrogenase [Oscillospiraceae bacterium]